MSALPVAGFFAIVLGSAAVVYFVFASFAFGARVPADRAQRGDEDAPGRRGGSGRSARGSRRRNGSDRVPGGSSIRSSVLGVEVEPIRVLILRMRRRIGGPADRVSIQWGNLFGVDLSRATVVTCFLWPGAMERLRPKFEAELKAGARVVSHWHPIPGWTPVLVDLPRHVYFYRCGRAG